MNPELMKACAEIVSGSKHHGEYIVGVYTAQDNTMIVLVVDMVHGKQNEFVLSTNEERKAWKDALAKVCKA